MAERFSDDVTGFNHKLRSGLTPVVNIGEYGAAGSLKQLTFNPLIEAGF